MQSKVTVRFIRKRNKVDDVPDKGVMNLIDAVKVIAPQGLDIHSMRLDHESDDADFYCVSTEISFIPADDIQRNKVFSTIDLFVPGYIVLEGRR